MPAGLWELEGILASGLTSCLRHSRPGTAAWSQRGRERQDASGKSQCDRREGNPLLGSKEDMVSLGCHWASKEPGLELEWRGGVP